MTATFTPAAEIEALHLPTETAVQTEPAETTIQKTVAAETAMLTEPTSGTEADVQDAFRQNLSVPGLPPSEAQASEAAPKVGPPWLPQSRSQQSETGQLRRRTMRPYSRIHELKAGESDRIANSQISSSQTVSSPAPALSTPNMALNASETEIEGREIAQSTPGEAFIEERSNAGSSATSAEPGQQNRAETAAELFAPREIDRSPQAWLARLTRQAEQAKAEQAKTEQAKHMPAPEQLERQPTMREATPLTQRTRTFLKPLVGIDPGAVPIYRDAQAAQATSALRADALSTGEAIEMAPGQREETPETLGLLAHELTHVARQQQPRFIPPLARPQVSTSGQTQNPEILDEETLALHVEQQVRMVARGIPVANPLYPAVESPSQQARLASSQQLASEENIIASKRETERGAWGNLPAPWEPLPDWLVSPSTPASLNTAAPAPFTAPALPLPVVTMPDAGSGNNSYTFAEADLRRAGTERSINEAVPESSSSSNPPEPGTSPEPDLDALARQVYSLLKRRLSVEQRRG
jgi:hypothetical protein